MVFKIEVCDFATILKYVKINAYAAYWVQGLRIFNVKANNDRTATTFFVD